MTATVTDRLIALAVLVAALGLLVFAQIPVACHPQVRPDPMLVCPTDGEEPAVCDGMFTAEGYACFRCSTARRCVDASLQIYCVGERGCRDPMCSEEEER
jgi:hypothetical protein